MPASKRDSRFAAIWFHPMCGNFTPEGNARTFPSNRLRPRNCGDSALDSKRSEEHTSELQSQSNLVCRLLLEKKRKTTRTHLYEIGKMACHLVMYVVMACVR